MFQHTGRHIKHRPMYCPDLEGSTPSQIKSNCGATALPKQGRGFKRKGNTIKFIYQTTLYRKYNDLSIEYKLFALQFVILNNISLFIVI